MYKLTVFPSNISELIKVFGVRVRFCFSLTIPPECELFSMKRKEKKINNNQYCMMTKATNRSKKQNK